MLLVPRQLRRVLPAMTCFALVMASQVMVLARPAHGQSFFQQLFGIAPAAQPRAVIPQQSQGASRPLRMRELSIAPRGLQREDDADDVPLQQRNGSYTTVCVRMCDGFYFPISHGVPRSRFYNDANACRSRCGSAEARLFYHDRSADMKTAVDLTGRSYAKLPIAFQHRKKLVSGCACKPEPWSQEALIRHETYAMAEGRAVQPNGLPAQQVAIVAGNYPDAVAVQPRETVAADPDMAAMVVSSSAAAETRNTDTGMAAVAPVAGLVARPATTRKVARAHSPASSKPLRSANLPKDRSVQGSQPKPVKVAAASTGGGKYTWPGDAPTRYR